MVRSQVLQSLVSFCLIKTSYMNKGLPLASSALLETSTSAVAEGMMNLAYKGCGKYE